MPHYTMRMLRELHGGEDADDYSLCFEGKAVGRCYRVAWHKTVPWKWSVYHQPPLRTFGNVRYRGTAETAEEATDAFKKAYESLRMLNGLSCASREP